MSKKGFWGARKSRGLLFTVMALFLIFGILTFNESLSDAFLTFSPPAEALQLYSVANSFNNASSIIFDLDKTGYAKTSIENIYPFNYSLGRDANSFSLIQEFSLSTDQIPIIFDYLNLSEIMLSDRNYSRGFSGVIFDINSPKNTSWLGSEQTVSFLILPFCYQYTLFDFDKSGFSKTSSDYCTKDFDYSKVKRIDLNIIILSSTSDFDSFLCNDSNCPQDSFNPSSPDPFYTVNIDDSNCFSCSLSNKSFSAHFSPSSSVLFELKGTDSNTLSINLSELDMNFSYSSEQKVSVGTFFTFSEKPAGFIVRNVDVAAYLPMQSAEKRSD